jgi:hypothetical protein
VKKIFKALTAATIISATVLAMADTANAQWGYRAGFNRGFGYRGLGGGLGYRGLGWRGYGAGRGYAGYGVGYAGYGNSGYAGYGARYAGYGNSGYAGYGVGYAGYGNGGYGCGACGTAIVVPIVVVPTVGCGCSRGFYSGF